jgi:hypothetical protein
MSSKERKEMSDPINTSLNDVFKATPTGAIDSAIGGVFYGINHRQTHAPVPINKDYFGLTFFTRPQLNLSLENARAVRQFIPLLTKEEASIQRIIRSYLDPRLAWENVTCPFVDSKNIFIPLLTNHLTSISGWPDTNLETFTSKPGAYKEVYSMVDSNDDFFSAFTLSATFRNMTADPITLLFQTWITYMASVFQGILLPYPDFLVKNEFDYNTRIYRLVLDQSKTFVQKIACTGAAFPTSVPMARAFDFQSEQPMNPANNEIQINFQCMGACYNDDIIVHEFNKAVGIFNSKMREDMFESTMQKVPYAALQIFNGKGYPRINPDSYELEWYVFKDEYRRVMDAYVRHMRSIEP